MLNTEIIDWWKPRLQHLDPWREITRDEIETLYASRPDSPSDRIIEDLLTHVSPKQYKVIFYGARGSGKTTELTRTGAILQDRFAVMQLDVAPALEENSGSLTVLVMIGVACLSAAHAWSAPDAAAEWPPKAGTRLAELVSHFGGYIEKLGGSADALGGWISSVGATLTLIDPATGAAAVATGVGVKTAAGLARESSQKLTRLSEIGRGPLGGRIPKEKMEDAKAFVEVINGILDELEEAAGRPPLLLVDGFDRLATIDEVWTALANAELFRGLDVPLVFSGPIQVRHHEQFGGLPGRFRPEILHNLAVVKRTASGGVERGAGVDVLLRAYKLRAQQLELSDDLFSDELLEVAGRYSSGIARDFFQLLDGAARSAMRRKNHTIDMDDMKESIRKKRHILQLALNEERYRLLINVLDKELPSAGADSESLLFENYIACYPNGDLWYRPHEILVSYLENLRGRDGA